MATLSDVEVVITGDERGEIADLMERAERLLTQRCDRLEYASILRSLVDALGDLEIGSETSDFVFPMGDLS